MNNTFLKLSAVFALLLGSAFGQKILTNTTLGAAVADGATTFVTVSSATGINAPSASDYTQSTYIYVDRELMDVRAVVNSSAGLLQVVRGAEGTSAAPHASSAIVFVVPAYLATYMSNGGSGGGPGIPQGSCTRANELALPRINFVQGIISDCNGGQWISGDALQTQRAVHNGFRFPDPGGTAYTALETSGTAPAANTEIYCSEIDLYYSTLMTGLGVLNGTTVGTDNHWVLLYDAGGKLLANSATAGALAASASGYQKFNFVNKYYAVGPGRYFACVGSNGTTATIRHAVTSTNDNILGGTITGQTFGTAAASITAPASFTTAKAPYFLVY